MKLLRRHKVGNYHLCIKLKWLDGCTSCSLSTRNTAEYKFFLRAAGDGDDFTIRMMPDASIHGIYYDVNLWLCTQKSILMHAQD